MKIIPKNGPDDQVEDEKNTAKVIPLNSHSGESLPTAEEITASRPIDHSLWGLRRSLTSPVAKATTEEKKPWWEEDEETEGDEQAAQRQQPQTHPEAPQRAPTQSKPDVKQGGKYDDFAQEMAAIAAKRKRAADNDGWKQHESVPPVGIYDAIRSSASGIASAEGKEFRQRDDLVIESREITPPETPENDERHEDEQSQGAKVDRYQKSNWYAYDKLKAARKIIREKQIKGAILREVLTFIAETSRPERDMWVFNLAQTHMSEIIGQDRKVIGRAINELLRMGLITKIRSAVANKISATYKLNF